jgi:hypothetical protein
MLSWFGCLNLPAKLGSFIEAEPPFAAYMATAFDIWRLPGLNSVNRSKELETPAPMYPRF